MQHLQAVTDSSTRNKPLHSSSPTACLSHAEQQVLLQQAVRLRRMKQQIQDETARYHRLQVVHGHHKANPTPMMLAQACGFSDDIESYEAALQQGQRAREQLVTTNLGLVHYCVTEILSSRRLKSLSRDDLVQEGCIGLARAVDRWNLDIGGRFSSYAVYWVRAAIFRCIAERDDFVRVPEHVSAAVRKVSRAAKSLGIEMDEDSVLASVASGSFTSEHDARWKEASAAKALAEEAGLTERQLTEAVKVKRRRRTGILSFETWMQQGRDFETDLVSLSDNEDTGRHSGIEMEYLVSTLSRFLRPKEMEAISWRYGLIRPGGISEKPARVILRDYLAEAEDELYGKPETPAVRETMPVQGKQGEAMSFVEVGKKMQVSAEYGRKLVHRALDKLRHAAEDGSLELALIF
jgi:RNA polymerase sigma factor (sigma-70 family)